MNMFATESYPYHWQAKLIESSSFLYDVNVYFDLFNFFNKYPPDNIIICWLNNSVMLAVVKESYPSQGKFSESL